MGALSLTWTAKYREPFEPLVPGVRFCPWDDLDGGGRRDRAEDGGGLRSSRCRARAACGRAPPEFLRGLADICRERGRAARLRRDPVRPRPHGQACSRTSTPGVTPDILTLAKPLGGGLPLGAVLLREELAAPIAVGDHGSTFGGNPVAAAAALAVLDRLTAARLPGQGREAGRVRCGAGSKRWPASTRAVAEVRGLGLMVGVEFQGAAGAVLKGLRERGILATKAGDKVLRLLPPLVVKPKEIRQFLEALDAVLMSGAGASTRAASTKGTGGAVA